MTRAEKIAELAKLREQAEGLVMQYNDGIQKDDSNPTIEIDEKDSEGNSTGNKVRVYIST